MTSTQITILVANVLQGCLVWVMNLKEKIKMCCILKMIYLKI